MILDKECCILYSDEGKQLKEKSVKEVLYRLAPSFQKNLLSYPGLKHALKLYQLSSPLGIIGNTIMGTPSVSRKFSDFVLLILKNTAL